MSHVDTRQSSRDSLLVLAKLRVDGDPGDLEHRVKVRNLSASGMMAEGDVKVSRGSLISVELRNIGWVDGTVAWKQDDRFGIAFIEEIDPIKVRAPVKPADADLTTPKLVRPPVDTGYTPRSRLRKI